LRNVFAVGRKFAPGSALIRPFVVGAEAEARSPGSLAPFMDRQRAFTAVTAVLLLVLTGLLIGEGVGTVGVHVVNAVLPHASAGA